MAFAELLDRVGSTGRFQVLNVVLLCFPTLFMATHNLLQNFTAAVPGHHCRVSANLTCGDNGTGSLDCRHLFIPTDGQRTLQKCRRFVTLPRPAPGSNSTELGGMESREEPCLDGWVYEEEEFASTVVTEVRRVHARVEVASGASDSTGLSVPVGRDPKGHPYSPLLKDSTGPSVPVGRDPKGHPYSALWEDTI
uniref:Uncharacterized protein n=1 Tax=Anolis carolinensis TaxID=28377 RepID=A0A803STM5_ANOCA